MIFEKKTGFWLGAVSLLGCLVGCGADLEPPEERARTIPARALETYPASTKLLLGEFQAQVRPLISIPVTAPTDGDIFFHVDQPRTLLPKHSLWAEVEPRQIASEELEVELNTRAERLRLREEIQQTERELNRVEFMLSDPALKDVPYGDRVPLSTNLVKQLNDELDLLEEKLENAGEVERLAFEQKALRSRLVMPFDGELILSLPVSPNRKTIRVASNTPIGTIRDISEIHLHVVIRDPQLVAIPKQRLAVLFKQDSGERYRAEFHDAQVVEIGSQDVLIYRFGFKPEEVEKLVPLIGANLTCELWVEADVSFHSVSKLDVALMLNGDESVMGWREAVAKLWPGGRLLYTGRTRLGVAREGEQ